MTLASAALDAAVGDIRSFDSVVVIGAGTSAASFPMTAQLPALLWKSFDDVSGAVEALAVRIEEAESLTGGSVDRSCSAKTMVGLDPTRLSLAWRLMRELPTVRSRFQSSFAALDADREPLAGHRALARLIAAGKVTYVISYNWDTCLERAFTDATGVALPVGTLSKPHGDAASPERPWILPDEAGLVPDDVHERLKELDDRPRALLVVGYSGSDANVVEKLLAPLKATWPVHQVSPTAAGEGAIQSTADEALQEIASRLVPQTSSAWQRVTFQRSRGLGAALRGERLRPIDVDACIEMPNAERLAQRLLDGQYATLSGESGSGKSITAFHAARRLNMAGWSVVEARTTGVLTRDDLADFLRMPGPVLAVVDDAQALPEDVRFSLRSAVDGTHAVLVVSTDRIETHGDETLSAVRATQNLHHWCIANIDTIAPLLMGMDDRLAWSAFAETPQQRLEAAGRSASSPWIYMFVASGGEQRIEGVLDRLSDDQSGEAAVLMGTLCIAQHANEDAGVSQVQLHELVEVLGISLTLEELHGHLSTLVGERLVVENGGRYRAAHVRLAARAGRDLARRAENEIGPRLRRLMGIFFADPSISPRGKLWLLQMVDRHESFRWGPFQEEVFPPEAVRCVVDQCLAATPGAARGTALYMLWSVDFFLHGLSREAIERIAGQVVEWIDELHSDEVHGFQWLLSGIRSRHPDLHLSIAEATDPSRLGVLLATRGTRNSSGAWSRLLQELGPGHGADAELWNSWRASFASGIDYQALAKWVSDVEDSTPAGYLYDLIDTLVSLATPVALEVLNTCFPALRREIEDDLAEASRGISDWVFGITTVVAISASDPDDPILAGERLSGEDAHAFNGDPVEREEAISAAWSTLETSELSELANSLSAHFRTVDWDAAARSLSTKQPYELESLDLFLHFLRHLSVDLLDALTEAIPDEWFLRIARDQATADAQEDTSGHLSLEPVSVWLSIAAEGPRGLERVRRLLTAAAPQIVSLPSRLIVQFPDIASAIAVKHQGVRLSSPHAAGWQEPTKQAAVLAAVDHEAAMSALRASTNQLRHALAEPQRHDLSGIDEFIKVSDSIDRVLLDEVFEGLPPSVRERWLLRLSDTPELTRALLERASDVTGSAAATVAEELLERDGLL
jgi:hypothetical protein